MATVGRVLLLFTGLVTGLLMLTIFVSIPLTLPRQIAMFVGTVSPSAVWYTSWMMSIMFE